MRTRAKKVIAMILLWASFITSLLGAYWYHLLQIVPTELTSGIIKDELICGFFIVAGIAATIHWVAMVIGVRRTIKQIVERERNRRLYNEYFGQRETT